MKRFFENKFAFVAIACLFTSALTWNLAHGNEALVGSHLMAAPIAGLEAHGPTIPPDPGTGGVRVAHGPTIPPDPGTGGVRVAHGPTIPPDPGTGGVRVAHGPTIPPDPGTGGVRVA